MGVIHSGKSTLIQSILFTFGINDVKDGLSEIIRYNPTFRLDFSITKGGVDKKYIIVRELRQHIFKRGWKCF